MATLVRCALASALFALLSSISFAADYGRTEGSFDVSNWGAATYTIPIWTPPGPNGITPTISLDYSSQSGNGLAGVGWIVSAATSIERCDRTKGQDGEASPVDLTLNDRFCMGGNRLRLGSGTYGVAGSVYFTEIADYSRITAVSTAGNGPQSFLVEAKSGLKYEFGNTVDSRVVLGGTVLRWMLNKVYDRNNNSYLTTYNNTTGFAVPNSIYWTPTNLGAATYKYEAKFNYDPVARSDKDSYTGKVAGFDVENKKRLVSIQIKSAGTVVRMYRLAYGTSLVTSLSRLSSVTECADDLVVNSNCLSPITFTYQAGVSGLAVGAGTPPAGSSNNLIVGRYDFNGDGKDDIAYYSSGVLQVAFGSGTGFDIPRSTGISTAPGQVLIDRFLPDGRDALVTSVSGTLWAYRWDDASASFIGSSTGISGSISLSVNLSADYDNDGLADLVTKGTNSVIVRRNTSTGSGSPSFATTTTSSASLAGYGAGANYAYVKNYFGHGLRKADVNGDHRQDIAATILIPIFNSGGQQVGVANYTTMLLGSSAGFTLPPPAAWFSGFMDWPSINFNSDDCTDRVGGNTVYIAACNGAAASTITTPATPIEVLDWDGDGRTDILVNSGGNFAAYLSTGKGFIGPFVTLIPSTGSVFAVDQDGDRQEDLIKANGTGAISYWTHTAAGAAPTSFAPNIPDLLSSVDDGYGVNISPSYNSTAWGNYTQGGQPSYPLQNSGARIVVAQVTASNGIGGTYTKTYNYMYARDDVARGEFAGFGIINETDSRNALISSKSFEQSFPKRGRISQIQLLQASGPTSVTRKTFIYDSVPLDSTANNQRFFVFPLTRTDTEYEAGGTWNGSLLRTIATTYAFDSMSGTLYDQTTTTTEPASGANGVRAGGSWVARTYTPLANLLNDLGNWCLGRPQLVQQINSSNLIFGASITRTTNIAWDAGHCRPTQMTAELGSGTLQVTSDIGYDGYGNVNSSTVTGAGMDPRTTTMSYSDAVQTSGQFPLSVTKVLSQSLSFTSSITWDYSLGVPLSSTDPNNLTTQWLYDPYGRRTKETRPDGTYSTISYTTCASGCDPLARMLVDLNEYASDAVKSGEIRQQFDQFDRSINESNLRTDGGQTFNSTSRSYDALGNVANEYLPFLSSASPSNAITITYDLVGRPKTISRPLADGIPTPQTTTVYYEGLTTRVEDPLGKYSYKIMDSAGFLARSKDHDGYYQQFDYDAFGNPKQVTDIVGNPLQSSTYNLRGMLTSRTDMDRGSWGYAPNALGELVSQTDAKGQLTSFLYDALGRLTSRSEAEGTSSWTWGISSAAKNIGRLYSMSGPDGYSETYLYDSLGRPSSTTVAADTSYQIDYSYNTIGALDTLTYPTSTSSYRLKLKYEYQYGHLYRIKDFNAPSTIFWNADSFNARDQVTKETLGNGLVTNRTFDAVTGWIKGIQTGLGSGGGVQDLVYTWDGVGNLASRQDNNQSGLIETFFYDNLHRLDYSKRNGAFNLDLSYDQLGNITSKSDVGSYTYHATKRHQVSSTNNGWSFIYDNNGNMTSGREGISIGWTSYNYPASITKGADTASFSYTPDRKYWKQISNYTTGGAATTIYVGGLLEKVTNSSGTDFRHMIRAGGSTIIVSRKSTGINDVSYVTSDHLGSSSAITNSSGGIVVNSSFDAFGKRRGSNWTGSPSAADWTAIASSTRRGYTEHSMLDNLNLIHMNGRVFDPVIGRFLSADPFIPEPLNTQSYNRYSYVYNRPLVFADPSGFRRTEGKCQFCRPDGALEAFFDGWLGNELHRHDGDRFMDSNGTSSFVDQQPSDYISFRPSPTNLEIPVDSASSWNAVCPRPDLKPHIDGIACNDCVGGSLVDRLGFGPGGRFLAKMVGDMIAPFRDDGANPLTGEYLTPRELNDAKFMNVINAMSAGLSAELTTFAKAANAARELSFGRKLDFLFNKGIDQSNAYNAARAAANHSRIGIADTAANRAEVTRLFNQAYRDPNSIVGPGTVPGSNLREFFLPGVTGTGSRVQFVELNGQVITIIPK